VDGVGGGVRGEEQEERADRPEGLPEANRSLRFGTSSWAPYGKFFLISSDSTENGSSFFPIACAVTANARKRTGIAERSRLKATAEL